MKSIRVVVAEISQSDSYLITQRLETAVLPLLWEFPGGRVQDDENDIQALERCLEDRIGATIEVEECLMERTHEYEGYAVVLAVYRVFLRSDFSPKRVAAVQWVPRMELPNYSFPPADQHTMDLLLSEESTV